QLINDVDPDLPRITKNTDFDPFRLHQQVNQQIDGPPHDIPPADLIIQPGSKSERSELQNLRRNACDPPIERHLRYRGQLMG
ncbi:cobyric acid synthase CobQ, partial [Pseudomonas syringae pv. tagetis]